MGARIQSILNDAQGGQAFANLARAFHLPPPKVEVAVGAMLDELVEHIEGRLRARRKLAKLVELLGQSAYDQVLDSPALLGATHTQVLGTDALGILAGRSAIEKMSRRAAASAGISEMISEYLLPVIAAMLVGALARLSRPGIETIIEGEHPAELAPMADVPDDIADPGSLQLPRVSGGVGFSGSTGGTVGVGGADSVSSRYGELAEDIRGFEPAPGRTDPADSVRRVLATSLGLSLTPLDWIGWMHQWSVGAINAVFAGWRR